MTIQADREIDENAEPGEGFVSNYLLYLLASASSAASEDFHAKVRRRGVRVPEWRVLACLSDRDGLMVTQLAQFALMEQSRMTKVIDQMALKGFVSRENDKTDRRRVRIHLTSAGKVLAEELVGEAKAHEDGIIRQLPPGDAERLKEDLKRINALCAATGISDGDA